MSDSREYSTDDLAFRCGRFKAISEDEWRRRHGDHGHVVDEDYQGVQPSMYRLAQLRCLACDAALIYIEGRETNRD